MRMHTHISSLKWKYKPYKNTDWTCRREDQASDLKRFWMNGCRLFKMYFVQ